MFIPFGFVQNFRANIIANVSTALYTFSSFTFTTAGVIGRTGPTQSQLLTAYTGSASWAASSSFFNSSGGVQYWTVPETATYRIRAAGAQGSNPGSANNGGPGAIMQADFTLTQGTKYALVVGQTAVNTGKENLSSSGGGGTFMVLSGSFATSSILIIAGGGGGTNSDTPTLSSGSTHTSGSSASTGGGAGGINGNGGAVPAGSGLGAGGGFLTNGAGATPGFAYVNGSFGGAINATYSPNGGGFGGGGSPSNGALGRCSGGGGFSGGGSTGTGNATPTAGFCGGGGGSYISASALNVSSSNGRYDGSTSFGGNVIGNLNLYNKGTGSITITKL
jgi:hypothetical protein